MKALCPSVGLGRICGLFGKTRQAFYDQGWRSTDVELHAAVVLGRVGEIRGRMEGVGSGQLYHMLKPELQQHGIALGRDRFHALLREHGLLLKRSKRHVATTDSRHPYRKWPDLVQALVLTATEQLWVSDITYLRTEGGFAYLSLVTDAWSRKIVGYHLSQQLKAQGCTIALEKAIGGLVGSREGRALVHHSDRGVQYCCEPYVSILQANGIAISMTQSGSPYDNAIAERVNGTLKNQLGLGKVFKGYAEAVAATCAAVDAYNRLRPHMSIGNLTPHQAHTATQPLESRWKKRQRKPQAGGT